MTLTRRSFLKATTGAIVAGAALDVLPLSAARIKMPIGIQLYSVRELLAKDFEGTLREVAKAGYQEVESAGYYDRSAADFKRAVENAGLKCVSAHHPLGQLLPDGDKLIQYGHDLGLKYLVCSAPRGKDPSARHDQLTLDDWKWNAEQFNRLGEKAKAAGMQFGYHNHVGELREKDGVLPYDELLRLTDPELVTMEMDCGWFVVSGHNPVECLKKHNSRFTLLHVKDMLIDKNAKSDESHRSTELGRGSIDYRDIFAAAKSVKHYFVEQEEFAIPPLEAIKIDADYMKKLTI